MPRVLFVTAIMQFKMTWGFGISRRNSAFISFLPVQMAGSAQWCTNHPEHHPCTHAMAQRRLYEREETGGGKYG